jgi:hypothetical protein
MSVTFPCAAEADIEMKLAELGALTSRSIEQSGRMSFVEADTEFGIHYDLQCIYTKYL